MITRPLRYARAEYGRRGDGALPPPIPRADSGLGPPAREFAEPRGSAGAGRCVGPRAGCGGRKAPAGAGRLGVGAPRAEFAEGLACADAGRGGARCALIGEIFADGFRYAVLGLGARRISTPRLPWPKVRYQRCARIDSPGRSGASLSSVTHLRHIKSAVKTKSGRTIGTRWRHKISSSHSSSHRRTCRPTAPTSSTSSQIARDTPAPPRRHSANSRDNFPRRVARRAQAARCRARWRSRRASRRRRMRGAR